MASMELALIPKGYKIKQIHIGKLIYEEVTLSNGLVYYQGPMQYSPLVKMIIQAFDVLKEAVKSMCEDFAAAIQTLGEGPHGYPSSPLGRALRSANEQANIEHLRNYLPPMRPRRRQNRRPHHPTQRRRRRLTSQP